MLFTDSVTVSGTRRTTNGYLIVDARFARTGIQDYAGSEMGRADLDTVRVYRPESEVFSDRAMGSFAHRPVTNDHPPAMVTAANWRDYAVGSTGDTVTRDGEHVRIAFTLMDGATIGDVEAGKRELSAGYMAAIDWTPGVSPQGEAYDAVMGQITGNHLAIVTRGRAGATCRIGDSWGQSSQSEKPTMADTTRAVVVDSVSYQMTDQAAQLVEKLTRDLADASSKVTSRDGQLAALKSDHEKALGTKDAEASALKGQLEAKDGEIAGLKAKLADTASIDALIVQREATIVGARRILGDSFDPKGKSDADIRRAAVVKRLGDAQATGKSDEYVTAAFDTLTVTAAKNDPIRGALRDAGRQVGPVDDTEAAHAEYVKSLTDGWKTGRKETV